MAGALGGDHDDIDVLRGGDGLEVDVEAVGESQGLALGHVGGHLLVVDVGAQLVGHQHHDHVAGLGGLLHFHHLKVGMVGGKLLRLGPVARALAQAHHHVDAALGQVFRVGMALAAKADDGNGLAVQHAQVAVAVVILLDRHNRMSPLSVSWIQVARYVSVPLSRSEKTKPIIWGSWCPAGGTVRPGPPGAAFAYAGACRPAPGP